MRPGPSVRIHYSSSESSPLHGSPPSSLSPPTTRAGSCSSSSDSCSGSSPGDPVQGSSGSWSGTAAMLPSFEGSLRGQPWPLRYRSCLRTTENARAGYVAGSAHPLHFRRCLVARPAIHTASVAELATGIRRNVDQHTVAEVNISRWHRLDAGGHQLEICVLDTECDGMAPAEHRTDIAAEIGRT